MNVEKLKNRDYYIVLDKSGSMVANDTPTKATRWKYAEESITAVARMLEEYDPDGITVVPFAGSFKVYDNVTGAAVSQVFREQSPMGSTVMAPPLQWCFDHYLGNKLKGKNKPNGAIILVLTDGSPHDEGAVAKAICKFTHKLDNGDDEFGISFVQVGQDPEATAYLKRLDDNLTQEGAKFDIVDTKTMEELETIGLQEALIASLTD